MHKYLAVLFTLVVLAGCSGGAGTVVDDTTGGGDADITDNRFGWGDIDATDDEEVADDDVIEDGSSRRPATPTITTSGITAVKIRGTVKKYPLVGEALDSELKALGGSGSYVWSIGSAARGSYSFPDWVEFGEQGEDSVKIVGNAKAGNFKFKVRACDEADPENCSRWKIFTVKVKSLTGVLPSNSTDNSTMKISEVPITYVPLLKEGELNTGFAIDLGKLQKKFKVTGGTGQYTWTIKTETEDDYWYCAYHDDAACAGGGHLSSAWSMSRASDADTSIFNLDGSFNAAVPYCDETRMTGIDCDGNYSIRETITLTVTDSSGATAVKSYRFKLGSPAETIKDLYVMVRIKGWYMWDDGGSKVRFELFNDEGTLIARSVFFNPVEDAWSQWRVKLDAVAGYENVSILEPSTLAMHMHDDAGCGLEFSVALDYIYLRGKYWSAYRDLDTGDDYDVDQPADCASENSIEDVSLLSPLSPELFTSADGWTKALWKQEVMPIDSVPTGAVRDDD